MTDHPISFDAAMIRALAGGDKTGERRLATSAFRDSGPGDRLWVRESFTMKNDRCAMMRDGWHQYADGGGRPAAADGSENRPDPARIWHPAMRMPRWASRFTLVVTEGRRERLRAIRRVDAIAQGLRAPFGLPLPWCWPYPHDARLWLSPVAAYRWLWRRTHATPGERWADDPEVIALRFTVDRRNVDRPISPVWLPAHERRAG